MENLQECCSDNVGSTKACEINGKEITFKQVQGFRRAFCVHAVYKASIGVANERYKMLYAFHVSESEGQDFPNMGVYASISELVRDVAIKYAHLWKLDGKHHHAEEHQEIIHENGTLSLVEHFPNTPLRVDGGCDV